MRTATLALLALQLIVSADAFVPSVRCVSRRGAVSARGGALPSVPRIQTAVRNAALAASPASVDTDGAAATTGAQPTAYDGQVEALMACLRREYESFFDPLEV